MSSRPSEADAGADTGTGTGTTSDPDRDGDDHAEADFDGPVSRVVAGLVAGGSTKPVLAVSVILLVLLAFGFLVAGLVFLLG